MLRENMIAHRSSLFEENSLIFMKKRGITIWESDQIPCSYRSTWDERAQLCVSKLVRRLESHSNTTDFSDVLMQEGNQRIDDDFIEVHMFGPMTVKTFAKVTLKAASAPIGSSKRNRKRRGNTARKALRDWLRKANVEFEEG